MSGKKDGQRCSRYDASFAKSLHGMASVMHERIREKRKRSYADERLRQDEIRRAK